MNNILFNGRNVCPSKVVCIGRNYVEHIAELGNEVPEEMVVFIKPNSAISSELHAFNQEALHYETELCFLVENNTFVAVTCGLDLTKRTLQSQLKSKGLPWERAKCFDGAAVFGEFVKLDKVSDELSLELKIDDLLVQAGSVKQMMYKPTQILQELRQFISLEDGDIVMTGTPKGVGEVKQGASYSASVILNDKVLSRTTWMAK